MLNAIKKKKWTAIITVLWFIVASLHMHTLFLDGFSITPIQIFLDGMIVSTGICSIISAIE